MRHGGRKDEERRKLFRKMEWAFVYGPPILAVFIAAFGALFLAAVVPIPGTSFLGRWVLAVLIILVLPAVVYAVRYFVQK